MSTLRITRGLPGSGKSTWARHLASSVRFPTLLLISRDGMRRELHPGPWPWDIPSLREPLEAKLTAAQHAAIVALLDQQADVIVHDTNLDPDHVDQLHRLAIGVGAEFEVVDFTWVPLQTCIDRDAARPEAERVGEQAIREMHDRWLAGR